MFMFYGGLWCRTGVHLAFIDLTVVRIDNTVTLVAVFHPRGGAN